MDNLIHCIYSSRARVTFDRGELLQLLDKARDNNLHAHITGMLLYADGSFFQVLEGPEAAVDQAFNLIKHDKRHDRVTQIIREPIARRSFATWQLAFACASMDPREQARWGDQMPNLRDEAWLFDHIPHGRARKLLQSFRNGRWRAGAHNSANLPECETNLPHAMSPA